MTIAVTQGEPAGVGPDVIVGLAQQAWPVPLVVVGDPAVLQARAAQLQLPLVLQPYQPGQVRPLPAGQLYCHAMKMLKPVVPGRLDLDNAEGVVDILRYAGQACLRGEFQAVVTAPVHKGHLNQCGLSFSGHTEFFAALAQVPRVVMMLLTAALKVALLTTHLPLRKVPDAVTPEALTETIQIIHHDLQYYFGIDQPRIAVCGLNPHAGEGGHLGQEEITVIAPTLALLRQQGLSLLGPLSADTIFMTPADVILAMYHDQGLPLIKYSDFHHAVNMTLGLPFIRTSVDHGTALSLAGTGQADPGSLMAATQWAITLAGRKIS